MCETRKMQRYFILAVLLLASTGAPAEELNEAQTKIVNEIAACLVAGLPPNWRQAEMLVDLEKPGAQTGSARYTMIRSLSGGQIETFRPCNEREPARKLVNEVRKLQPAERRGWTSARFTIQREGKFDLTFDYPKK